MDRTALFDFYNVGSVPREWDPKDPLIGHALALPSEYREIRLNGTLHIEFLESGAGDTQMPNKNHVIFRLPFEQPHIVVVKGMGMELYAARVSMDISDDFDGLEAIEKKFLEPEYDNMALDADYRPGAFNVKMLKYSDPSISANAVSTFSGLGLPTLGAFIDFIKDRGIHQMSFLPYGQGWKGCRDFITQTFVSLRAENKISALDEGGHTFKSYITKVHHKDTSSHEKLVESGIFVRYVRIYPEEIQDAYEPADETFIQNV